MGAVGAGAAILLGGADAIGVAVKIVVVDLDVG